MSARLDGVSPDKGETMAMPRMDIEAAGDRAPVHAERAHHGAEEALSQASEHPSVFVIVLNWNGMDDTVTCVESLEASTYPRMTVVVVDNGSTEGSLDRVTQRPWAMPVTVLQNGRNLGYAEGNNVGIRLALEASADLVLVLNNDTTVAGDTVSRLVQAAAEHPTAAALGPLIVYQDRPGTVWFSRALWRATRLTFEWPGQGGDIPDPCPASTETDYVCGAALLLRADAVRRIGLFDPRFFLVFEDTDWCFRARRGGFLCRMVPGARVWHKVGTSFGSEASPLRAYFSTRNELLWAEKHLPRTDWARLVLRALGRELPGFSVGSDSGVALWKRTWWALLGYGRDVSRLVRHPIHRASRAGLRDYLCRRFGDCPPGVRQLAREWTARNLRMPSASPPRPIG
jgi:GT2 family glycosyltransferase